MHISSDVLHPSPVSTPSLSLTLTTGSRVKSLASTPLPPFYITSLAHLHQPYRWHPLHLVKSEAVGIHTSSPVLRQSLVVYLNITSWSPLATPSTHCTYLVSDVVGDEHQLPALGVLGGPQGQHPRDHAHVIQTGGTVDLDLSGHVFTANTPNQKTASYDANVSIFSFEVFTADLICSTRKILLVCLCFFLVEEHRRRKVERT